MVPPNRRPVLMAGGPVIVICSNFESKRLPESVTLTVKVNVPTVVGLPEIMPVF